MRRPVSLGSKTDPSDSGHLPIVRNVTATTSLSSQKRRQLLRPTSSKVASLVVVILATFALVMMLSGKYFFLTTSQSGASLANVAVRKQVLLTDPLRGLVRNITTDVRGNLGPAHVMLNNGSDWIKDRWQAASDMGGTAIKGAHWVRIDFHHHVRIRSIVLDWEAAYSDHYDIQILESIGDAGTVDGSLRQTESDNIGTWRTILSSPGDSSRIQSRQYGQSPGVKKPTPLHVVHNISMDSGGDLPDDKVVETRSLRIWIAKSAMGWGVSLWQIQIYGYVGQ